MATEIKDDFCGNFDNFFSSIIIKNNEKTNEQIVDNKKNTLKTNSLKYEHENNNSDSDLTKYFFDQLYAIQQKYERYKIIEQSYQTAINKLKKYTTFRVDIQNRGTEKNQIEIVENSNKDSKIAIAKWLCNDKGNGVMIQCQGEEAKIKIKCIEDGTIIFNFRGIDYRYNGKRYPIFVKCKKIKINGENIKRKTDIICHDNDIKHEIKVNNNDEIFLELEWEIF